MADVQVTIVHDEFGEIVSVNRPAKGVKVTILAGERQSILVTDIDENKLETLIGTYRVDVGRKALVQY